MHMQTERQNQSELYQIEILQNHNKPVENTKKKKIVQI